MKVTNEADWLKFKADLARDDNPEVAASFLAIIEEWASRAERRYEHDEDYSASGDPLWCLRQELSVVEQNHGTLSGLWIFEMLVLLDANWVYGGDLYEALSDFEKHSYSDVARAIVRESQEGAEALPGAPEN